MGKSLNWLYRVLIGWLGLYLIFAIAVAGAQAPCIIIDEPNYDFGELSEIAPLSHNFIVKNSGNVALNIKDVQPS